MAVSEELDLLSCELMGEAFDRLAAGEELGVAASVLDASGERTTCAFTDDSEELCLEAARDWVHEQARTADVVCYAIAYLGAVASEEDADEYADALILEFGERGATCAYSAYSLVGGIGEQEGFSWTDPAAAGELPCLL